MIRFSSVLAAGLLALGAAAAFANVAGPPPKPGKWKVTEQGGGPSIRDGRFVVTNHRTVRDFTFTSTGEGQCAVTGTVTVAGQQRIWDATGVNHYGIHYSDWVVGTNHPNSGTVIQTVKVTVDYNGKQYPGGLSLAWVNIPPPRHGQMRDGTIKFSVPGEGRCAVNFTFKKI